MSTAILIGETVKKDVVYSAECFDQKPMDSNTQLVVEYSVMAPEALPCDAHDVIKYIDAALDLINGSAKIGAFAYPPLAVVLLPIAQVGSFIQFLMKWIPDNRPDPVVLKYKELEKAIDEFGKAMDVHFADMQSFMTEHNFNVNITTQSKALMMYMRNCLKYQNEKDVENFKEEYEKNSPLSLAFNMASLLEYRSTNPLIMAMDAKKAKTKATFNKWKTIITGILGEFLFIETFASGLLGKSDFNQKQILELWNDLLKSLDEWEDGYKDNQWYWEEVKNEFENYIVTHTHLNNEQKAKDIKDWLDRYLTRDAFYICVFNENVTWKSDYYYWCPNSNEQMIGAWSKGMCNAFIYRSRTACKKNQQDYDEMRARLGKCAQMSVESNYLKRIIKNRMALNDELVGIGICCMFAKQCKVEISYLNHLPEQPGAKRNLGPGDWTLSYLYDMKGNALGSFPMIFAFD